MKLKIPAKVTMRQATPVGTSFHFESIRKDQIVGKEQPEDLASFDMVLQGDVPEEVTIGTEVLLEVTLVVEPGESNGDGETSGLGTEGLVTNNTSPQ